MHCTNINHPKIIDWAMEFNKTPEYIGAIVSLWQESNNRLDEFPSKLWMEEQIKSSNKENEVSFALKSVDILTSQKADEIFRKGDKNNWDINKILTELKIPKEQKELLLSFNTRNREEILNNLLANYSYTVEINTTKGLAQKDYDYEEGFRYDGKAYMYDKYTGEYWYDTEDGKSTFITKNDYQKASALASGQTNTQHYSNLTVPGGTNYTENEIKTPAITPSIKGHAQFSTDKGIGWFRSDDKHAFTGFLEDLIASGTIKKVPC